jgi:hypothetical protein
MQFSGAIHSIRCIACVVLLGSCPLAMAQYMWIDDKGIKQFSDRPPPPSVPAKRILKAPGKPVFDPNAAPAQTDAAASVPGGAPADAATGAETGAKAAPTLTERNAAFNQRRADAAAADKKAAADAQQQADTAANCDAARQNQRALDQGIRIANVDKSGERAIMTDAERAEFGKKNQKVLAGCQ